MKLETLILNILYVTRIQPQFIFFFHYYYRS